MKYIKFYCFSKDTLSFFSYYMCKTYNFCVCLRLKTIIWCQWLVKCVESSDDDMTTSSPSVSIPACIVRYCSIFQAAQAEALMHKCRRKCTEWLYGERVGCTQGQLPHSFTFTALLDECQIPSLNNKHVLRMFC